MLKRGQLADLAMSKFSAEIRRSAEWWKDFQEAEFQIEWTDFALGRSWKVRAPSGYVEVELSKRQVNRYYNLWR